MKKRSTYKVALTGMLFALAIGLSVLESWVSALVGLPPGVKLGLANIVVMFALLFVSKKHAVALIILKAGFALLTRGGMAGLLSFAGSTLSLLLMLLLLLPKNKPSMVLLSIVGALGHNFGQLIIVCFVMGVSFLVYAPVLLISGVGMGILTAVLLNALLPALAKLGLRF